MKKHLLTKILIILFTMFCCIDTPSVKAQGWLWGVDNKGGINDAWPVATDPSGNVFCAGTNQSGGANTIGGITFPNVGAVSIQVLVAKLNSSGAVQWVQGTQGANAWLFSITTDPSGNLLLFGSFEDPTLQIGSITLNNPTSPSTQYFVAKFDPLGNVLWAINDGQASWLGQFINGAVLMLGTGGIATDAAGNVYITSNFFSSSITIGPYTLNNAAGVGSTDDIFVAKYSSAGVLQWATSIGGTAADDAYGITVTPAGNIYITGCFTSPSMSIGASVITDPTGVDNAFIAEINPTGNPIWASGSGSAAGSFGAGLTSDASNNVYMTGGFLDNSITLSGTTINSTYPGTNRNSLFLTQFSPTNVVTWSKSIGSPTSAVYGFAIGLASCGQVWVSGNFTDSANIDGHMLYPPANSQDPVFIAGYNLSGGVAGYSSLASGGDDQNGIACDASGNVYMCSDFVDAFLPFVVGPDNLWGDSTVGLSAEYLYIAKYFNPILTDTVHLHSDSTFCAATAITLNIPVGYTGPYTWSNGSTAASITVDSSGIYWVKSSGSCGSTYLIDTFHVHINVLDTLHQHTDTTICAGSNIILNGPGGYFIYNWSTGATSAAIMVGAAGTVWVSCSDSCALAPIIDTFHITVSSPDTLHNIKDTAICAGSSISLPGPIGYPAYQWSNGSTSAAITVSGAGTFWVSCSDSCAMPPVVDTFHLAINPRDTLHKSTDTTICSSTGMTLHAPSGYLAYQWYNGDTTTSVIVPTSGGGTFWVSCIDSCTIPNMIDTFHVIFDSINITFSLGNDTFACQPVLLTIPENGVSYLWQDGSKQQSYMASHSGTYFATVSKNGCQYTDTVDVGISYQNTYNFDTNVCLDNQIRITITLPLDSLSKILWNTGSRNKSLSFIDTGLYFAFISDSVCTVTDTIRITGQYCNCWCHIPNAFTPAGALNQGFKPIIDPYCNPHDYTFSIYDRWGKQVYTTNDPTAFWDGTYTGVPADMGVYMYQASFHGGLENKRFYLKGDVTLVR